MPEKRPCRQRKRCLPFPMGSGGGLGLSKGQGKNVELPFPNSHPFQGGLGCSRSSFSASRRKGGTPWESSEVLILAR